MRPLIFIVILFLVSCKSYKRQDIDNEIEFDNSNLSIQDDSLQFQLKRCIVTKNNDSIIMNFSDTSKHSNYYELEVIKTHLSTISSFRQTFSVTDSSYRQPKFQTVFQKVMTNKSSYLKGDSIQGEILLKIISFNSWPEIYTDTLLVQGKFKAIVK
jgi:hypothetical protein